MNSRDRDRETRTIEALDLARTRATKEGRVPTAAEYSEAIRLADQEAKKADKGKSEPVDDRASSFIFWIRSMLITQSRYLQDIKEQPGGFDPAYLAEHLEDGDPLFSNPRSDCEKAIKASREAIRLIQSVLDKAKEDEEPEDETD